MDQKNVWFVGAGPGDPELITVRGRELLSEADLVVHDAAVHPALLGHCRLDAKTVVFNSFDGSSAEAAGRLLVASAEAGLAVVRLTTGDPFFFSATVEEAESLGRAGVPFGVVPGVFPPAGSVAYAGFSLTHRLLSSSVRLAMAAGPSGERRPPEYWARFASDSETLCVLGGISSIDEIAAALVACGRAVSTPAAALQGGTGPSQRVVVATLGTVADAVRAAGVTDSALLVVGEVVALRRVLRWYDAQPLFGRRLLVLRPASQAQATAKAIRQRGAEPIVCPAIRIEPPPDPTGLDRAACRLASYQWVVFTSTNGVESLFRALGRQGRDARAFGSASVAAIGPQTASALLERGVRADCIAREFVGEALGEAMCEKGPLERVLILRALEAREALPDMLRGAGAAVDVVPAYQTRPATGPDAEALARVVEQGLADVVLVTATSTVKSLLDVLGGRAAELLASSVLASIGPITTQAAEKHGLCVHVTAERYTVDGLLDALERYYRARDTSHVEAGASGPRR